MGIAKSPPREVNQFYLKDVHDLTKISMVYTSLAAKGYVREYGLHTRSSADLVSLAEVGPIAKGPNDALLYCYGGNTGNIYVRLNGNTTRQLVMNDGITRPKPVAAMAWDPATSVIYAVRPRSQKGSLELLRVPYDGTKYRTIPYPRRGTVVGVEYYDTFLYIAVNTLDGSGVVDQVQINPSLPEPLNIIYSYHTPGPISINSLGVGKVDVQPPNNVSVFVHQYGANYLSRFAQYYSEPWYIFQYDSQGAFLLNKNHPTFVSATHEGVSTSKDSVFTITEKRHQLNELYHS